MAIPFNAESVSVTIYCTLANYATYSKAESAYFLGNRHVGLWRAAVVDLEVDVKVEQRFRAPRDRGPVGAQSRVLRLLVGDGSGARSELSVPYHQR